jgi:hypothetical protein
MDPAAQGKLEQAVREFQRALGYEPKHKNATLYMAATKRKLVRRCAFCPK